VMSWSRNFSINIYLPRRYGRDPRLSRRWVGMPT